MTAQADLQPSGSSAASSPPGTLETRTLNQGPLRVAVVPALGGALAGFWSEEAPGQGGPQRCDWLRPAVFGAMDGLVSNFALMAGVPARRLGWVGKAGVRLVEQDGAWVCPQTGARYIERDGALSEES